jgi:uncharacterized membrane protein YkoI
MTSNRKGTGRLKSVGLIAGGVVAGAVLLGAGIANAATSTASPSAASGHSTTAGAAMSSGSRGSSTAPAPDGKFDHGGAAPVRGDEKSVSTADAATLKAAALKAVPGATIYRVETDAGDGAYEVHLTKADGTLATVKFDKNLAVTKVETGMGQGDPAPAGHGGPPAPAGSAGPSGSGA